MHGESSIFTAACNTIVYDCTLSHLLNAPSSASPVKYKTVLIQYLHYQSDDSPMLLKCRTRQHQCHVSCHVCNTCQLLEVFVPEYESPYSASAFTTTDLSVTKRRVCCDTNTPLWHLISMHKLLLLVYPKVLDDIKLRLHNRTLPASSGEGEGKAMP